ncbi:MAG: hypothetical protein OEZ38_12145, partial [Gammaproteobacteria bacterium]|nr:hypothetical protein [Gammaproteobacteria bacterium]
QVWAASLGSSLQQVWGQSKNLNENYILNVSCNQSFYSDPKLPPNFAKLLTPNFFAFIRVHLRTYLFNTCLSCLFIQA